MGKESVIVSSRSLQPTGNIRGQYAGVDGGHQGKRIWKPGVMWGQVLQSHFPFFFQEVRRGGRCSGKHWPCGKLQGGNRTSRSPIPEFIGMPQYSFPLRAQDKPEGGIREKEKGIVDREGRTDIEYTKTGVA